MLNPKETLEAYLDKILLTVWDLNANLSVITYLRKLDSPEKVDAYKVLNEFFSYIYSSALTHLILTIDRLYEEPKAQIRSCANCNSQISEISYGERSLIWYLTQLKTHSSNFAQPKRIVEEVNEQFERIEEKKELIKKIGLYRDKWFAHRDKKYFDNPDKIWEENPLLFEELETLVTLSNEIVGESFGTLKDTAIDWDSSHMIGLDRVFNLIMSARETIPLLGEYQIRERRVREFIQRKCGDEVYKEFIEKYSIKG